MQAANRSIIALTKRELTMKELSYAAKILGLLFISAIVFSFSQPLQDRLPYAEAGLTERQAAAHVLARFSFGAKPGEVDAVVKMGLEKWLQLQLAGTQKNPELDKQLANYDALQLTNEEVAQIFPRGARVLKEAIAEGVIEKEEVLKNKTGDEVDKAGKKEQLEKLQAFMDKKGYRKEQELYRQFASQKILRAAFSNNQLHEVLTDFWFNHFNVSATKNNVAQFVPAYERDVIRPHVAGSFKQLLLATAHSPAMLFYLDNFNSSGTNEEMKERQGRLQQRMAKKGRQAMRDMDEEEKNAMQEKIKNRQQNKGLNENYAREIMELHTLGVDGGYTQQDVTEAARVLTGWTVYPIKGVGPGEAAQKMMDRLGKDALQKRGFVHKGDFLFAANRHDSKPKTVMGKTFTDGGYEEGVNLITMLATHPATARHICRKLAVHFVSDTVPETLVDKMAKTFLDTDGHIGKVLLTLAAAPEFWSTNAVREKTKSPFALAISAVRALDAKIEQPFMLYQWIAKMGQKLYYYQAPTGFPDRGQYWINTGSLLNRMKFGLAIAAQKIPGISFNLAALNNNHEPESAKEALEQYSKILLPERDLTSTLKRLTPLLNEPQLQQKIDAAHAPLQTPATDNGDMMDTEEIANSKKNKTLSEEKLAQQMLRKNNSKEIDTPLATGNNTMLAQVVGIILGSPEFQRR
jgi:uncharacterized protein (DUF1800 family)